MQRIFFSNLVLTIFLNLLIKPLALFGIDATVQNRVGPEEYGLYFSLLNLSVIFNMLIDLGINNYTTKNIAKNQKLQRSISGNWSHSACCYSQAIYSFFLLLEQSLAMTNNNFLFFLFLLSINYLFSLPPSVAVIFQDFISSNLTRSFLF